MADGVKKKNRHDLQLRSYAIAGRTIMKNDSAGKWRKDMLPYWAIIWG